MTCSLERCRGAQVRWLLDVVEANTHRLTVMRGEAARRSATWAVMGLTDDPYETLSVSDAVTLLVLSMGANDRLINRSCPNGVQTVQAFPGRPLVQAIGTNRFGAVIIDQDIANAVDQIGDVRRDPRLADWPVLAISDVPSHAAALTDAGATLTFQPHEILASLIEVPILVQERAMRLALSAALKDRRMAAPSERGVVPSLIDRTVLDHHITRVLMAAADRHESALPVSLLTLWIDPKAGVSHGEIGRLIAQIVRGEDLPANLDTEHIAILMPATDEANAQVVKSRLESFLGGTRTSSTEPPLSEITTFGLTSSNGVESADAFLTRALKEHHSRH